mmetsp:Transcript_31275/g.50507  ORF Transcript_31275/g.50507 Transcript_31275/m.50507 type:complete len:107 (+) Transcript_31275:221-541(+)
MVAGEEFLGLAPEHIVANRRLVYFSRIIVLTAGGSVCGILGLSGLAGFAFLMVLSLCVSVAFLFDIELKNDSFFMDKSTVWSEGISHAAFSFVLFWTIFYDIVHVY